MTFWNSTPHNFPKTPFRRGTYDRVDYTVATYTVKVCAHLSYVLHKMKIYILAEMNGKKLIAYFSIPVLLQFWAIRAQTFLDRVLFII